MVNLDINLKIFYNFNFKTEIIKAGICFLLHLVNSVKIGLYIAAIPFKTLMSLINRPLNEIGINRFLKYMKNLKSN